MLYLQMEDVERGEIERGVIVVREDTNHGNSLWFVKTRTTATVGHESRQLLNFLG